MEINKEQYDKIKHVLPVQHGNVSIDNVKFINALLYICPALPVRQAGRTDANGGGYRQNLANGIPFIKDLGTGWKKAT